MDFCLAISLSCAVNVIHHCVEGNFKPGQLFVISARVDQLDKGEREVAHLQGLKVWYWRSGEETRAGQGRERAICA